MSRPVYVGKGILEQIEKGNVYKYNKLPSSEQFRRWLFEMNYPPVHDNYNIPDDILIKIVNLYDTTFDPEVYDMYIELCKQYDRTYP